MKSRQFASQHTSNLFFSTTSSITTKPCLIHMVIYFLQMFSFYPLKAPENQELSGVIRVYKMETLTRNEMTLQKF